MSEQITPLELTRRQLALAERALEAIHRDILPVNKARYELMAESYVEQIMRLRAQVDAYLGVEGLVESIREQELERSSEEVRPSSGGARAIQEHERVVLTEDIADEGLRAGDVGTVVHVHGANEGYEVEFITLAGRTVAVATALPSQVRPVGPCDLTHVRELVAQ
jgi:hypothetical protein